MGDLTLPAPDAPAEEWGRLAVRIPGWRWMPGMQEADVDDLGPDRVHRLIASRDPDPEHPTGWSRWCDRRSGSIACMEPAKGTPDPDDPATAGCLLRLLLPPPTLGHVTQVLPPMSVAREWQVLVDTQWGRHTGKGPNLGRACIAAAAALGRWPGGAP